MRGRLIAVALAALFCGCPAPRIIKPPPPEDAVPPRFEAVLINGGHRDQSNYHSHLVHIRRLVKLLRAAGIGKEHITIMASDGPDPSADLAVREPGQFEDHWLIQGTELGGLLGSPVMQINSGVAGMRLLPAKRATLQTWFQLRASELEPGDTLLVFVTDHGFGADDVNAATIALWGEKLPVPEFMALLDNLDPKVRVILWMSQCYSGAFARAIYNQAGDLRGNVCGFFSTNADRVAWGCYPEARDDHQGLGHSMRFLDELQPGVSLGRAHDRVLVTDRTPDVPHRASDHFLANLVRKDDQADRLLEEAWKDSGRWGREIETIDRLSRRIGLTPPRFLRDLDEVEAQLQKHQDRSRTYKQRWSECLGDLRRFNMTRFSNDRKVWQAKTLEGLLKKHGHPGGGREEDEQDRAGLIEKLIGEFKAFIQKDAGLNRRISALHAKQDLAADINLRLQVRQGIILRIRTILRSVAGEVLAAKSPELSENLKQLRGCEDFTLPGKPAHPAGASRNPPGLPALADDLKQLDTVQPAWLGVHYGPEHLSLREKHKLGAGAVVVRSVIAGSAADRAGIRRGDTIAGLAGRPFLEPGALRELVMLAAPGQELALQIIRRGKRRTVPVRLEPFPDETPRLPDKPAVGQAAPALLGLQALRGELPPEDSPVLLVFFTTWCGPCKTAYQPLIDWEQENGIPVVMVTGEPEALVQEFLTKWDKPMPNRVALDLRGLVTDSFSAGKYPTFVFIKDGKIQAVQQGYTQTRGLTFP